MKAKLIEGPVGPLLAKLTFPMIWGIFAMIAFNVADTFFVGQLGTLPLAAMSFTFPVVTIYGSFAMGLGVGISSAVSIAIGKNQHQRASQITTVGLMFAFILGGIFILIGLLTIDPLFQLLGADEELLPQIRSYMEIWYPGMFFLLIPMVGNFAIRATGDTKSPGIMMVIAAIVNIVLDPLLIFGAFGIPGLGLVGAAWATVGSRALTLIAALWILGKREKLLVSPLIPIQSFIHHCKEILSVGIPACLTNMIVPLSVGIVTRLVAQYGPEAVAGFGVASRIESFTLIPLLALSASIGPFVGQNWAAQKTHRLQEAFQLAYLFCLAWGVGMAILLAFTATPLTRAFDPDLLVIHSSTLYLKTVPISYGLLGILFVTNASFNSSRRPLISSSLSILRVFVIYVPLALLLSHFFGLKGIYLATTISSATSGCLAYFICRKLYPTYPPGPQSK